MSYHDNIKFFYCYNPELSNFLTQQGEKYITKAISYNKKEVYTMFFRTPELSNLIDQYKKLKK